MIQTFGFQMNPPPYLTVNYLENIFFENVDLPNSTFKWVVFQLLKCLYYKDKSLVVQKYKIDVTLDIKVFIIFVDYFYKL